MTSMVELEETIKKLVVRLKNVEEGKQIDTLVQILEDLHSSTFCLGGKYRLSFLVAVLFS